MALWYPEAAVQVDVLRLADSGHRVRRRLAAHALHHQPEGCRVFHNRLGSLVGLCPDFCNLRGPACKIHQKLRHGMHSGQLSCEQKRQHAIDDFILRQSTAILGRDLQLTQCCALHRGFCEQLRDELRDLGAGNPSAAVDGVAAQIPGSGSGHSLAVDTELLPHLITLPLITVADDGRCRHIEGETVSNRNETDKTIGTFCGLCDGLKLFPEHGSEYIEICHHYFGRQGPKALRAKTGMVRVPFASWHDDEGVLAEQICHLIGEAR
mmetsp:Transcript_96524/g.300574  ORF Transcript_96524/g.300574 Transcript_96524/m.300574 type:complete len:266 (-) Transcript_96524:417-1214(-)